MKTVDLASVVLLTVTLIAPGSTLRGSDANPRLIDTGPDFAVWQSVTPVVDDAGQPVLVTNTWTEIATGLNHWDAKTQRYAPTVEAFEISADGYAVARQGPHRAILSPNLRSWGAIDLETPDGHRFRSHLLGLAYFDPGSGRTVTIAQPQDSVGVLAAPNRVVWEKAFRGIQASVRLTYTKAGIEHDVVLQEALPPPSAFGLPDTARLEVWHELVEAEDWLPAAQLTSTTDTNAVTGSLLLADEQMSVGSMNMGVGRAFATAADDQVPGLPALQSKGALVRKSVHQIEGRRFLVEAVTYAEVARELETLPASGVSTELASADTPLADKVRMGRQFPPAPPRSRGLDRIELASTHNPQRGLTLDWVLLNSTGTPPTWDTIMPAWITWRAMWS